MENIIPSSDLRNRYPEISKLSKETHSPFFITVNGRGDGVYLDLETYEKMREVYLLNLLAESEEDVKNGRVMSIKESFENIRKALDLKWNI